MDTLNMDTILTRFEAERSANTLAPASKWLLLCTPLGVPSRSSIEPAAPRRARNPTGTLQSGQSALLIREADLERYTAARRLLGPFTELIVQIDGRRLARCIYPARLYEEVSMILRSMRGSPSVPRRSLRPQSSLASKLSAAPPHLLPPKLSSTWRSWCAPWAALSPRAPSIPLLSAAHGAQLLFCLIVPLLCLKGKQQPHGNPPERPVCSAHPRGGRHGHLVSPRAHRALHRAHPPDRRAASRALHILRRFGWGDFDDRALSARVLRRSLRWARRMIWAQPLHSSAALVGTDPSQIKTLTFRRLVYPPLPFNPFISTEKIVPCKSPSSPIYVPFVCIASVPGLRKTLRPKVDKKLSRLRRVLHLGIT
ncbi:hypothetical protein B0H11DRAFT_1390792 [Mycena galericulata]|nr:hypothetical protein B0H11DRAFT_1390792 [Mycena galericulata]